LSRSLNNEKNTFQNDIINSIVNLRVTHKKASIPKLEDVTFSNIDDAMNELSKLQSIQECLIFQTCNRVEIFAVISPEENATEKSIAEFWLKKCNLDQSRFYSILETAFGEDALMHVLRLTSGIESMIIGEEQILGQIREALQVAINLHKSGPILQRIFESALRSGILARQKTHINKHTVSIGSVVANFLEDYLGNLEDKKILVIGTGQIGSLVCKSLRTRKNRNIFVANRTNRRASCLAKSLKMQVVSINKISETLISVDAIVVATASSSYVLKTRMVSKIMQERGNRKLLILDLSQPRNVEEDIGNLPNIELKNIDNLRGITTENMQIRLDEVKKVESMLDSELHKLVSQLKQDQIEPLISIWYSKAEKNRQIEVNKALKMMKIASECNGHIPNCNKCMEVVINLSQILVKKTLMNQTTNLRKAAANGDLGQRIETYALFNFKPRDEKGVSKIQNKFQPTTP
jgi:glutamyl-tRNA reductase